MTKEKQKLRDTLRKLFALLGSPNKNEADTARQKIDELAAKHSMSWNDVIELVGFSGASADDDSSKIFDEFMQAMGNAGKTQADILIELAGAAQLFRTEDDRVWADFFKNGHRETWEIRSKGFKRWLHGLYFERCEKIPSPEAVDQCLNHLDAVAHNSEAPIREVHLRCAGLEDKSYIDLCNKSWEVIEVDGNGWRVIKEPPVRFTRTIGMQELPLPTRGGDLSQLRALLNVDEDSFVLVIGWLAAALRGKAPYPVIAFAGPAGSSKSTAIGFLRDLIDANLAQPGALPMDVRNLCISATKRFVQGYDNLSHLSDAASDQLCRFSTGGTYLIRQLFTDDDEILFTCLRPIILGSIGDIIGKNDLSQRTNCIVLEPIDAKRRKTLSELQSIFVQNRPQILGCLLDIVSEGFKNLPSTRLPEIKHRMADYLKWMTACEGALWPKGTFGRAYDENKAVLAAASLEADTIATIIIENILKPSAGWEGTATQLLGLIDAQASDQMKRRKSCPRTPDALARRVRNAHEIFVAQGWKLVTTRSKTVKRDRLYRFAPLEIGEEVSNVSARPNDNDFNDLELDTPLDTPLDTSDTPKASDQASSQASNGKPLNQKGSDHVDALDTSPHNYGGRTRPGGTNLSATAVGAPAMPCSGNSSAAATTALALTITLGAGLKSAPRARTKSGLAGNRRRPNQRVSAVASVPTPGVISCPAGPMARRGSTIPAAGGRRSND